MDVSLRLVNNIPKLKWNEHEIAAVCKEVGCTRSDWLQNITQQRFCVGWLSYTRDSLTITESSTVIQCF